jgi:hypothetical protein
MFNKTGALMFFIICSHLTVAPRVWAAVGVVSMVNVHQFGAMGNGIADDTSAVLTALRSNQNIHFPAGIYLINNSGGPALISNFSSSIVFDPGAFISFSAPNQLGIQFTGGSHARLIQVAIVYKSASTNRMPGSVLSFTNTTDTYLYGVSIDGSPGGGISFQSCIRPVTLNINISNTIADGLVFANSQDAVIDGVTTNNTGDDGLGIHNFLGAPQQSNGQATNISVSNSKARGISCSGCMDLDISHFSVNNTSAPGVQIDLDPTSLSYTPTNVVLRNGTVTNAGQLTPLAGNQYGIELNDSGFVRIADVIINNSGSRGVSVSAPTGTTVIDNVVVSNSGSGGAGIDLQGQNITVLDSSATYTSGSCFAVTHSVTVTLNNITGTNCNQSGPLNRAIDLELISQLVGGNIQIVDNQPVATGYGYFDWNVTAGFLESVSYSILSGRFSFGNTSSGIQIVSVVNLGMPTL